MSSVARSAEEDPTEPVPEDRPVGACGETPQPSRIRGSVSPQNVAEPSRLWLRVGWIGPSGSAARRRSHVFGNGLGIDYDYDYDYDWIRNGNTFVSFAEARCTPRGENFWYFC